MKQNSQDPTGIQSKTDLSKAASSPAQPISATPTSPIAKSRLPLILIGIVLVSLVGIGGVFLRVYLSIPKPASQPELAPVATPTATPTADSSLKLNDSAVTADWKEYHYAGLSFKFPPHLQGYNLSIIETTTALYPDHTSIFLNASNPTSPEGTDNDVGFIITKVKNLESLSAIDWWTENINNRERIISNVSEEDYIIQTVNAENFSFLSYKHKFVFDQGIIYKNKSNIYLFSEQVSANNPAFTKTLFDQILPTLEFID